jgi:outer membrane protein
VKLNSLLAVAFVFGAVALTVRSQTATPKPVAVAPATKIAVVAMRDAMLATLDGKAAIAQMQTEFEPRRTKLEKEDAAIQGLEAQIRNGNTTISAENRQRMADEVSARKKRLERDLEDLNTEAQAKDSQLMQDVSSKMGAIVDQYAKQNGYTVVIDASAPLLWASESANVTPDIVKAYDQAHPAAKK